MASSLLLLLLLPPPSLPSSPHGIAMALRSLPLPPPLPHSLGAPGSLGSGKKNSLSPPNQNAPSLCFHSKLSARPPVRCPPVRVRCRRHRLTGARRWDMGEGRFGGGYGRSCLWSALPPSLSLSPSLLCGQAGAPLFLSPPSRTLPPPFVPSAAVAFVPPLFPSARSLAHGTTHFLLVLVAARAKGRPLRERNRSGGKAGLRWPRAAAALHPSLSRSPTIISTTVTVAVAADPTSTDRASERASERYGRRGRRRHGGDGGTVGGHTKAAAAATAAEDEGRRGQGQQQPQCRTKQQEGRE